MIALIDEGLINNSIANRRIFPVMLEIPSKTAKVIAEENAWIQESDTDTIDSFIQAAIDKYPEKVKEYKSGKTGLLGLFMGEVMKASRGKADPKVANQILRKKLEEV
jgi:aspartyl-tRNA(Asn)/glutamyl-tRNA(Gln) amidotransferase subunit B